MKGDEEHCLPDSDGNERGPEVGRGNRATGVVQSGGGPLRGWQVAEAGEQEVGAGPDRPGQHERGDPGLDPADAGERPAFADQRQLEHGSECRAGQGQRRGKGHREARAAVGLEYCPDVGPLDDGLPGEGQSDRGCGSQDGVGKPSPGPGEPGAGPVVPPERDHGHGGQRVRRDRAEDQQRGRGAAGAQGEGEEDGRAEQQPAHA